MDSCNSSDFECTYQDVASAEGGDVAGLFEYENMEYEYYDEDDDLLLNKRRNSSKRTKYWEVGWGKMLKDPELQNPNSTQAKKFRRRFRLTYSLYLYIVDLCREVNLFETKKESVSLPMEIKILIGLRILARGNCGDDIEEMSGVKESTVYNIFHTFIEKFSFHFYEKFVYFPQGEMLALYSKIGLPGTWEYGLYSS